MSRSESIDAPAPRVRKSTSARRWYVRNERLVLGVVGLALILTLWQLATATGYLNRVVMSSPDGVIRAAIREAQRGEIWSHLWASILEFTLGFLLAALVGITIGLVAGWWRRANFVLDPWITVLYSTPTVALVPLIILVLGIDLWAKVFVVFLITLFPIVVNTLVGVRTTSRQLLDIAVLFGAKPTKQWTSVVLPGSLPFILTGLRLGGTHGMVGVVVAELVAGNQGIGFFINKSAANLQAGSVMLGILLLGLWGVFFGEAMRRVEQRFESWRPERV
jgi:NitT/TauT family transport system permease protein